MHSSLLPFLLSGLFLISTHLVQSQSNSADFVELVTGEILEGEVQIYAGNKRFEKVSILIDDKKLSFPSDSVRAFEFGKNIRYETDSRTGKFWQVLVKGSTSLYSYKDTYYVKNQDNEQVFILSKKAKYISQSKDYDWHNELSIIAKGCLSKLTPVPYIRYKDKDISNFIHNLNNCHGNTSTLFNSNKNKLTILAGLNVGAHNIASSAIPRLESLLQEATGNSINYEFGIATNIYLKHSARRFTLAPEINIRNINSVMTSEQFEVDPNIIALYHDVFYQTTLISAPVGFKVLLNQQTPEIYFKANMIFDYHLSGKLEAFEELENSSNTIFTTFTDISTTEATFDVLPQIYLGYGAAFGMQFKLAGITGALEVKYEKSFTNEFTAIFNITHQRIGANIKVFL